MLFGPRGIGPVELIIILVILLLIFGAGRLAGIGAALGQSIREFRRSVREEGEKAKEASADDKSQ